MVRHMTMVRGMVVVVHARVVLVMRVVVTAAVMKAAAAAARVTESESGYRDRQRKQNEKGRACH